MTAPAIVPHGPVVLVLDHFNVDQTSLLEGVRNVLGAAGIPLVVYANDSFATQLRPAAKCLLRSTASQADLDTTVASTALPSVELRSRCWHNHGELLRTDLSRAIDSLRNTDRRMFSGVC